MLMTHSPDNFTTSATLPQRRSSGGRAQIQLEWWMGRDFTPYTYVRNNPVRLVDPTGHLGTVLEFLDDLVNHPSSAIAKGVLENLDKRGEAAVEAPAAVAETLRKYGPAGFLKAIGGGAHHLVRDTGEALGEITWEVKHYEGDSSKEKIARRTMDVVLNTADAVTLVQGGVNIGKGLVSGGKAVAQTVKGAAQTMKPAYALATGTRAGAAALEATVVGTEAGGASVKTLGSTVAMMSASGKGSRATPKANPQGTRGTPAGAPSAGTTSSGTKDALRYKLKPGDIDLRGAGISLEQVLEQAFNLTGYLRIQFSITKWGKISTGSRFRLSGGDRMDLK